jgi:PucR C-terminal helix-turn-helix domain
MTAPAAVPAGIAGPERTGSGPVRSSRFLPFVDGIVAEVLARIEVDMPELVSSDWRRRADEKEFLTFELRRRLVLCAKGTGFDAADLDRFAGYFSASARRGAPLRTMQRFLRASIAYSFTELWARAEPGDVTALLRLSRWLSRHHGPVERLLVKTYCELLTPGRRGVDDREALALRLLTGLEGGGRSGSVLGPYLVVVFQGPLALTSGLPAETLTATVDSRQHMLVPVPAGGRAESWRVVARWITAGGGTLAAGTFAESSAAVPEAAAAGRRLLAAAGAVGLPPGLVGARDLVLESTLANRTQGLREVAGTLDVLDAEPRLIETLAAFFGNDLDRTRTARDLFLSRGGLSLRLDRIAQLTGLDPRSTRGIQVLGSAISARALLELAVSVPQ